MDGPRSFGLVGPAPRPGARPGLSVIRPALLVGEYPMPEDAAWLRDEHGVTVVVSLQDDADLASKGLRLAALERAYREHGLAFHRFPVPDGDDRNLAARLGDIVALLRDAIAAESASISTATGFNARRPRRSRTSTSARSSRSRRRATR
jgi:hypothetical protein